MDDEITKQAISTLPAIAGKVYDDALSGVAKELGGAGIDAAKTLRLLLAPLQYTAHLQDRLAKRLKEAIDQVPKESLVAPRQELLNEALSTMRFKEDGAIADAFVQLLKSALNKETSEKVHPAFPQILGQLSADEALLIYLIFGREHAYLNGKIDDTLVIIQIASWHTNVRKFVLNHVELDFSDATEEDGTVLNPASALDRQLKESLLPIEKLAVPSNIGLYVDHLVTLGLLDTPLTTTRFPNAFKIKRAKRSDTLRNELRVCVQTLVLTPFGRVFAEMCIPPDILNA